MLARIIYIIAGVDTEILARCPKSDRLWAMQLGAWLIVSFSLIFLIALHSTSYVPVIEANLPLRIFLALLIALTITLFDRALYQSDWFYHGHLQHGKTLHASGQPRGAAKLGRIAVRLLISFFVAYGLSTFLELAIFSGSIMDRLEQENRKANAASAEKVRRHSEELHSELESRRSTISARQEALLETEKRLRDGASTSPDGRLEDIAGKRTRLQAQEQKLLLEIKAKEGELSQRKLEVIAETEGTQSDPRSPRRFSGRPTCGRRCRAAQQLAELCQTELLKLQSELLEVRQELARMSALRDAVIEEIKTTAQARQASLHSQRAQLSAEIERAQNSFEAFKVSLPKQMQDFEDGLKHSWDYVQMRSDPLLRLRALQELKADPVYGPVVTTYAWSLKLFIIFLEIVPVLGKLFFAPPSAYAIYLQQNIELHQKRDVETSQGVLATSRPSLDSWTGWRPAAPDAADLEYHRHLTIRARSGRTVQ